MNYRPELQMYGFYSQPAVKAVIIQAKSAIAIESKYLHSMITLRDVNKTYYTEATSLHVLKGIDLHIEQGDYVSIMGASGSGKSTLAEHIGNSGQLRYRRLLPQRQTNQRPVGNAGCRLPQ